jgi:hypothetical protein
MSEQHPFSEKESDAAYDETGDVEQQNAPSADESSRATEAEMAAERQALTDQQNDVARELEARQTEALRIAGDLEALTAKGENFQMLASVCESLESLQQRGVGTLFWGEDADETAGQEQVHQARAKIDEYHRQLRELEAQHQSAIAEVEGQQDILEVLDYELYQAQQREESRKREWLVERDEVSQPVRLIAMPWMRGFDDDRRFRNTLAGTLATALLLGLLIPMIDIPIPEREELIEVPERLAKFIREERKPPPPPVREELPEPEPQPDEPEPEEIVETPPETELATVEPEPKSTREKVNSKGILAFRENFSALSDNRPAARLGSEAKLSTEGQSAVGMPQRAMVAAQGPESSGGINLAAISRDVGGGGVELVDGVQVSRMESSIDGGGSADRPRSSGAFAGRTDEEIQIVFDRYKAALYRLYNRALRKDPTLRGQIVLRLTIEPDGTVSLCNVQASDMKAPELSRQVVDSVTAFQFGAKEVPPVTILYPIDFLPTA